MINLINTILQLKKRKVNAEGLINKFLPVVSIGLISKLNK